MAPAEPARPARYRRAMEVRREGLGKGTLADHDACLNVPFDSIRSQVCGGDERMLIVVDVGLGVDARIGAISRVDGTWLEVDRWRADSRPVPREVRGEADGDCAAFGRPAIPTLMRQKQRDGHPGHGVRPPGQRMDDPGRIVDHEGGYLGAIPVRAKQFLVNGPGLTSVGCAWRTNEREDQVPDRGGRRAHHATFPDVGAGMVRRSAKWSGDRALGRARRVDRGRPGRGPRMQMHPCFDFPDAVFRIRDRCPLLRYCRPELNNQCLQGGGHGRYHSPERAINPIRHPPTVNGYRRSPSELPLKRLKLVSDA